MSGPGRTRFFVINALRAALFVALVGAVWLIYRRLPPGDARAGGAAAHALTRLHIVLEHGAEDGAASAEIPVHLYSIDVASARREFDSEPRRGVRFEEFVQRRMGARKPLTARLDARGHALVEVPPGRWWVHATLDAAPELTWRLPINVAGREQTVELTPENAYTRAKRF